MKPKKLNFFTYIPTFILLNVLILAFISIFSHKIIQGYNENLQDGQKKELAQVAIIFEDKLNSYLAELRSIAEIYRVTDFNPSNEKLKNHAVAEDNFSLYPGALGFGFIRKVEKSQLEKYLEIQKKINPDLVYKTIASSPQPDHFVIESIEPFEKNRRALGLDVGTETNRRNGFEESYRLGIGTITHNITLVQAERKGPGYLIFIPIYKSTLLPPPENRYRDLIGFAYTPVLASEMEKYINNSINISFDINIVITSGKISEYAIKNFDPTIHRPDFEMKLKVIGKDWIIQAHLGKETNKNYFQIAVFISSFLIAVGAFALLYFYRKLLLEKEKSDIKAQEATTWLDTIMDNIPLSIISTDTKGIIKSINPTGEKILGHKKMDLIDIHTPQLFHDPKEVLERTKRLSMELDRDIEVGFETFVVLAREKGHDIHEWTLIKKDQSRISVRLIVSPLYDSTNELIGYVGIGEDISDIKELEQTVMNQRLTMLEAARLSSLGEMAGGMAHEINTPLAVISAKVSQLSRRLARGEILTPNELKDDLQIVDDTVLRIAKIINGLRTVSRDPENDLNEKASIKCAISDALDLCSEKFRNHQIEIRIDCKEELYFYGKPTQITQVILNLLNNSFDAIETKENRWVSISAGQLNSKIIVTFTDCGSGIDEEIVEKIMNPFFTTKKLGKGTGLGLSISKTILEKHKGKLYYVSDSKNTQFVIELPIYN